MNYEVKSLEKCSFSGIKTRNELLEAARSEGAEVEDDAQIFVLLEDEFRAEDATYIIEDANDYVFYSNTSLSLFVPDGRDGIIEAVEENKTLSKAMSILGKKTSAEKKKSSPENGKKGGAPKKTYYLLSGEGEEGIWSGPFETTGRAIRMRAKKEECGGDRWCRIFELYQETETRIACVIDIDNNDTRDVPDTDED